MPTSKTKNSVKAAAEKIEQVVPQIIASKPRHVRPWVRLVGVSLGVALGAAVLMTAVVAVGSYVKHWQTPFVRTVASVVPYPAVIVNGSWRPYADFLDTVSALETSYDQPGALAASGLTSKPTRSQVEMLVLDRMVKDEIVHQIARKRNIVITQTAIDTAMQDIVDQSGSRADVEDRIRTLYGWDIPTFSRRVVRPYLERQRLQESIAFDDAINADQKRRMDEVLERLQGGQEDFGALAAELNEDGTKDLKGDYGIFGRGERDPLIEDAVFGLEVGATTGIIRTSDGFHILKLLERIPADAESGDPEKVHASHIYLAAEQLDAWLYEQVPQQKVRVVLSGYRWDSAAAQVVLSAEIAPVSNTNSGQ